MLNELSKIQEDLNALRHRLHDIYSKLDPTKNEKSKSEILNAQLDVMQAVAKVKKILEAAEKIKQEVK